uniref:Uncharacterized protein n=1 Tax=Helianthus annuus TaxID=4232 RepID=A0A251TWY7_HELAN
MLKTVQSSFDMFSLKASSKLFVCKWEPSASICYRSRQITSKESVIQLDSYKGISFQLVCEFLVAYDVYDQKGNSDHGQKGLGGEQQN